MESVVISTSIAALVVHAAKTPRLGGKMIDALESDPKDDVLITDVREASGDLTLKEME